MANIFAIITANENLNAEINGAAKASVIFTVTNQTGKPVRGVARIQPLEGTQEAWLSLDGEPEKEFPAHGTQQYTVLFNKPLPPLEEGKSEPEEKYPFRLTVASAVRPDEDFDEGPKVTIFKPERKGKGPGTGPPWWIFLIIGIIVLLLLAGGLFFGLRSCDSGGDVNTATPTPTPTDTPTPTPTLPPPPSPITQVGVPGVEGLTLVDASIRLQKVGLVVKKVDLVKPEGVPGRVAEQNPKQGVLVVPGSPVTLNVVASTTVPNLIGKNFAQVNAALNSAGLVLGTRTIPRIKLPIVNTTVPQNEGSAIVSSQSLTAGSTVAKGRKVNIVYKCPSGQTCSGSDVKN